MNIQWIEAPLALIGVLSLVAIVLLFVCDRIARDMEADGE